MRSRWRATGKRAVRFSPTMKMSTYLVAFVVGDLEATDPVVVDGVEVRVVHVPGRAGLTPFALEVAAHALRFFSDYFAIAYPGTSSTSWPSPTSPSGPWRTWAA